MSRKWWLPVLAGLVLASVAMRAAFSAPVPVYMYVTSWGTAGSGAGQFSGPQAVSLDASRNVWVADTGNNRLEKFTSVDATPANAYVSQITSAGSPSTALSGPRGVVVDPSGNLWISDTGNNRLVKLSPSLAYLLQIKPGTGKQNGRVNAPSQIAFANNYVWETDPTYDRVQQFTSAGAYSRAYGQTSLHAPYAIAFDATGTYAYASSGATTHNVVRFKYSGARLGSGAVFVGANATGTASGRFNGPRGVAVFNGSLFVADSGNNRVQVFNASTGAYITQFGGSGSGPGQLSNPTGLAADPLGRIYVADTGNNRIQVFYADQLTPVTSANAPAAWSTTNPVSVSLTATDGIGSGVAATYYRVNGGAAATYTAPVSVSAEGTTTLSYWSVDNVGNIETAKTSLVRIDTGKPTSASDAPAAWQTAPVNVTITASDTVSGVAASYYRLNGGATTTYTVPVPVSAEGTNTLQFWSVDAAGNVETTKTSTVRLDLSAPTSTDNAPASWLNVASVSVTLSRVDTISGVAATYYKVNGGATTTYTVPLVASAEGTTTIAYWSVDAAGNVEPQRTAYARIDRTAPAGSMAIDYGDTYTATTTVSVCSSVLDISPLQMRVDAGSGYGSWVAYADVVSAVTTSTDGTKTVTAQYRDGAGNVTILSDTIVLNSTAPAGTMAVDGGASYTSATACTVDSAVARAADMRVDPGTGTYGPWVPYAATVATAMPGGDGTKTLRAQYRSATGLIVTIVDTIVLDTTAPVGTALLSGGAAATGTRTVTVDSAVFDLTPMTMRVNAGAGFGPWVAYSSSLTTVVPAGDGTKTVSIEYQDSVGHTLALSDTILLDTLAPTTTNNAPAGWQRSPVNVTLTPVDAGSGVAATLYRLNGGAVTTYTAPVAVGTEGGNVLQYWSVDAAGNVESVRTATITMDLSAPGTTDDAPVGWQSFSPVTVTLSGSDAVSGLSATYYRLNGGATTPYTLPVDVTADGDNVLQYWSVDVAGNVEPTETAHVQIDTVSPTTLDGAPAGWSDGDVPVTLTATDSASGVDSSFYILDGGGVSVYGAPVVVSGEGTHTLECWSVDIAGNVEDSHIATVQIDLSAPVTTDNAPAGWRATKPVSVTLSATDGTSGVAATYYRVNGGSVATYTTPLSFSAEGTTTLSYWSTDRAGNAEATKTATVLIDTAAPAGTMVLDAGDAYIATTTVSVDSTVTDASGPLTMRVDGGTGYGAWIAYAPSVTATVPSGDGTKTVNVQYRDQAGNVLTLTDTIKLDSTAPAGTMAIDAGAAYTATTAATVDANVARAVDMRMDTGSGYGAWMPYTASKAVTLPAGDGVKSVDVQYRNNTGLVVTLTDDIVLDTTAPTGTMSVAGGASYTATRTLSVDSAMSDLTPLQMRVDAGTGYGPWAAYASAVTTQVTAGDGTKTLTVQYVDGAGNIATRSDTIVLDTTAPGTTDNAPTSWRNAAVSVTLSPSDALSGVAATYYRLDGGTTTPYGPPVSVSGEGTHTLLYWSTDNAGNVETTKTATVRIDLSAPATTDDAPAAWQTAKPVSVTLTGADAASGFKTTYYRVNGGATTTYTAPVSLSSEGTTTLSYWSVDNAGNTEATKTATVRIDTVVPSGAMVVSHGDAFTATVTVSVDSTVTDASGPVTMRIDGGTGYAAWIAYAASVTATVPAGDGTKTVTVQYKDVAGNVTTLSDTIVLNTTAPSGTMSIAGGASYTATTTTSIDSAVVGAVDMRVDAGSGYGAWMAYAASTGATLPSGDGTKTVNVQYRNSTGMVVTLSDTIVLDTTAPTGTMSVAGGASYTATRTLSVDSAMSDLTPLQMRVDAGTGYGPWAAYASAVTTQVTAGDGTKTLTVQYRDGAGNIATRSDTIVLDTTAPNTTDNAPGTWQNGPVSVTLSPIDLGSGVRTTYYRVNGGAITTYTAPVSISAEGTNTLSYWTADNAGNTEVAKTATVRIDLTAPVTSSNAPAAWQASKPVSVTLTASDAASGVKTTYYRVNGGATTTYTAPVSLSSEGTTTLSFWSVDNAGNTETAKSATVRIDTLAPATTDNAPAAWQKATTSVTLTPTDGTSGVSRTFYRINGGASTTYTAPVSISAEGTTTLSYWSVDNAGNGETAKTATVRIDLGAPVTTDNAPAAWQKATTVVTLAATDATSGVKTTFYKLNGGATTTYTAPVSISAEGIDTLQYWSVDNAGNTEATKTATVRIDLTAPATTSNAPAGWVCAATTVTLSATDATSGVQAIYWRLNGGTIKTYTGPLSVSAEGTNTLQFWAVDNAGNSEAAKTATVRIDLGSPVTTDDAPAAWQTSSPVGVTLSASDATSGVKATFYKLNGGATTTYTAPVSVSGEGTKTVQYWSVDNAGNTEATKTATVRIDVTKPVTTSNAPAGWIAAATSVSLTATDAVSGWKTTYFKLNGGATTTYTAPVPVSAEGTDTLQYWSVDNAGNVEATQSATVRIDLTAPVTTSNAPAGWSANLVFVTLTPADSGAGTRNTYYRLNGGAATTYTVPVAVSAEGTNALQYWSVDNAGNTETTRSANVRVDTSAPVTSDNAPAAWRNTPASVSLTPTDTRSGVKTTYWRLNGGATTTYTAPVSISAEGVNTLAYWSVDNVGNTESIRTATVSIDSVPPSGTMALNGGDTYAGDTTVEIDSGVTDATTLQMRFDNGSGYGAWTPYAPRAAATMTSGDGTKTVSVQYRDAAGNTLTLSDTIVLDSSAPFGTMAVEGGATYAATAAVSIDSSVTRAVDMRIDLGSGYGSWTAYAPGASASLPAGDGAKTVRVQYRSGTGLIVTLSDGIVLDTTAPSGTMTVSSGAAYATTRAVSIDASVSDVSPMTMRIDLGSGYGPWVPYASSIATQLAGADGTKTVTVQYRDAVGLTTTIADAVMLDLNAPVTSAAVTTSTSAANITLNAADAASGVSWTRYRLDGGPETTGTTVSTSALGGHTLTYRSADRAGNVEATKTATFSIRGALAWSEVAGPSRYNTAIAISQRAFPSGSSTVIMATGGNYPDALGGGALAGAYDCPILLVPPTVPYVPSYVSDEVRRLHASKIVILGSNLAVSDAIMNSAKKIAGVTTVQRVYGKTRYDTADAIARETIVQLAAHGKTFSGKAFVMTGGNFPDALVASPMAFRLGRPLLLCPPTGLNAGTNQVISDIGVTSVTIVDSGRYVPSTVDSSLVSRLGASNVARITASGAPAISVAVGAYAESQGMSFDNCGIATSQNFPDALAGGPLQAHDNAVLLLTPTNSLDGGVSAALTARKGAMTRVKYFGSILAVSQAVRNTVQNILK